MRLQDKVTVITGSSRGIGRETALAFAKEGSHIVVNYTHSQEKAEKVAEEIRKIGRDAIVVKADVTNRAEVKALFSKAFDHFGKIDILINNAGISRPKSFLELTDEDWDEVMDANLKSMFITTQEIFPYMQKQNHGRIVNLASAAGQYHGPFILNYAVSKAGVISLTKTTARFGAPYNILINAVAPGMINSEMIEEEMKTDMGKTIVGMSLLKRPGEISDVVASILFLASDEQNYITGHVISISGGGYLG